ncbi:hypothetical protein W02_33760 [Nitrospira sp. KM1]|nr:hypothetical protein [Nitrospira sp. KM1]BCA56236.1 hypothetical protein W02_33760 [Nitrospira sp. KM1]
MRYQHAVKLRTFRSLYFEIDSTDTPDPAVRVNGAGENRAGMNPLPLGRADTVRPTIAERLSPESCTSGYGLVGWTVQESVDSSRYPATCLIARSVANCATGENRPG